MKIPQLIKWILTLRNNKVGSKTNVSLIPTLYGSVKRPPKVTRWLISSDLTRLFYLTLPIDGWCARPSVTAVNLQRFFTRYNYVLKITDSRLNTCTKNLIGHFNLKLLHELDVFNHIRPKIQEQQYWLLEIFENLR